jgi:crotonobetainyl-CoA:carnitine CoA-transferase CaiB-like acyl-CoA transferase
VVTAIAGMPDQKINGKQHSFNLPIPKAVLEGQPPHRGEHNAQVLKQWLGIAEKDIEQLHNNGVLIYNAQWRHH